MPGCLGPPSYVDLRFPELILRWLEGVPGSPWKSQQQGQEDQEIFLQLCGSPLALLSVSGTPGLPFGSSLGSLGGPYHRGNADLAANRGPLWMTKFAKQARWRRNNSARPAGSQMTPHGFSQAPPPTSGEPIKSVFATVVQSLILRVPPGRKVVRGGSKALARRPGASL